MNELVLEKKSLSHSWQVTTIKDISYKIHYGYTATATTENTGTNYLRITDIQNNNVDWSKVPFCSIPEDEINKYFLHENDLVFARTGGTVGKSFLMRSDPPKSVFASYLIRIIISDMISSKFIHYFFNSPYYWNQISLNKTGLKTNVNAQILSQIKIPLAPLNEQKRIVAKIEELFSHLDNAKKLLQKTKILLKQQRSSFLKLAFEGKLTEKWREENKNEIESASILLEKIRREKDSKSKKQTDLNMSELVLENEQELPKNWAKFRFGDYLSLEYGKGLPENKRKVNGSILVYGSSGIVGHYDDSLVNSPCLIIGRKGSAGEVHYVNVSCWPIDTTYFLTENSLYDLRLLYYLLTHMKLGKMDSSTTIPSLRRNDVYSMIMKLPPLNEQKRIVAKIEEGFSLIENNERAIDLSLKNIEGLRKSILKQAFKGKLVLQDPNDESASALLERIKQEKERLEQTQRVNKSKSIKSWRIKNAK